MKAYEWDYRNAFTEAVYKKHTLSCSTQSVGIYQWLPAKKGLKKSGAICRVVIELTYPKTIDGQLRRVKELCEDMNKHFSHELYEGNPKGDFNQAWQFATKWLKDHPRKAYK